MTVEAGGVSHAGRLRELNEDAWAATTAHSEARTMLLAVADGMGGHSGGELASRIAVETLIEVASEAGEDDDLRVVLTRGFATANQRVFSLPAAEPTGRPGTTLTAALLHGGEYCVAHVGDTRAYLVSSERIVQITEDQSWVAEQVRLGHLGPNQARSSTLRSHLLKALGTHPEVDTVFYRGTLQPAEALLICSDGLWEHIDALEIASWLREAASIQDGLERIVALALERGGEDNITAVCARQGGAGAGVRTLPDAVLRARAPTPVPGTRASGGGIWAVR